MELRWSKEKNIAGTNHPAGIAGGRKIIWLSKDLKPTFASQGSSLEVKAGLAIVLAHELTHQADFTKIDKDCSTQYSKFMLEANAHLTEIAVYHELRTKGLTPSWFNSGSDTVVLQLRRFHLDIWNYKHGGPKPDINSYSKFKEKGFEKILQQTKKIIAKLDPRKKGVFALAEVINVKYGYRQTPGFLEALFWSAKDKKRYNTLYWSTNATVKKYADWRKKIGSPTSQYPPVQTPPQQNPAPNPQQPHQPQQPHPGNGHGGGGGHSGGGGWQPPFNPNPHFPDGI